MPTTSRPNILWLCTDQQRFDTLGCSGNPWVRTPNVDRLALNGVRFSQCFSQSPVCTPSRASFLTGRYPRTTRCRQNGQSIPADEVLVTKLFHDAGYVTGLAGKLHLSVCNPSVTPGTERRIDDGYDEFHWSHHPKPDWPTNEYVHWLRDHDVGYHTESFRGSKHVHAGMPAEHHQTTWCAQKTIDFIDANANGEHPWLFSFNCFDPHHPFDPPVEYLEPYLNCLSDIPLPNYVSGELENKPIYQQIDHRGAYNHPGQHAWDEMSEEDHRLVRAAYWAMCDLIDVQAGRILDALDQSGQRDNTIVIFMSDHGEMLGDHGMYLKGPYFYESAIHVPLIVSWPGQITAGLTCDALIELTDLAPTLLQAADLPHHPGMQGRPLWPILTGAMPPATHRDDVFCEYYNAWTHRVPPSFLSMVRTDRYKLVAVHGQQMGELYDLVEDPNETYNRWHDPAYQSIMLDLYRRLCDRMAETVDPLPPRQAMY